MRVAAARSGGVAQVASQGSKDFKRENISTQERLHQFTETLFPFCSVRIYTVAVVVVGHKVRHFVYKRDKKRIPVEVVVNGDEVILPAARRSIIAIPAVAL